MVTTNRTGTNPADGQSRVGEAEANLSAGLAAGRIELRFAWLIDQIEARFPGSIDQFSSRPPEISALEAIDKMILGKAANG